MTEETFSKKSKPNWIVIAIAIIVGLCLLLVVAACMFNVVLALLGPSVGNIFSNIMDQIATPVP